MEKKIYPILLAFCTPVYCYHKITLEAREGYAEFTRVGGDTFAVARQLVYLDSNSLDTQLQSGNVTPGVRQHPLSRRPAAYGCTSVRPSLPSPELSRAQDFKVISQLFLSLFLAIVVHLKESKTYKYSFFSLF